MKNLRVVVMLAVFGCTGTVVGQELHRTGLLFEDITRSTAFLPAASKTPAMLLPAIVDNSSHLPPVGNQSAQGSCVAWALGYYYKTYQEWQENGWSVTSPDHIYSPAFMYNHINGGWDGGAYFSDAMKLLNDHGCATIADFPYVNTDYTRWPADSVYRHAMAARTSRSYYISAVDMAGVQQIKQHLANGNIAVLGIFVYGNFDNITSYNNTYCALDRIGNNRGGHAVTIVGYDDSRATSDGTGAFRLVNSWGTGYGDQGFFWMSYQAVIDSYLSQRIVCYTDDRIHYSPTIITSLNAAHTNRNVLKITYGVGISSAPGFSKQFFNFSINSSDTPAQPFPANDVSCDLSDADTLFNSPGTQIVFLAVQSSVGGTVNSLSVTDLRCSRTDISTETPTAITNTATIITTNVALPVELSAFTAAVSGTNVVLRWRTETEVDNFGFSIERCIVPGNRRAGAWQELGFVHGGGTSWIPREYAFTDRTAAASQTYSYRLKQIDRDGSFAYSSEAAASMAQPAVFNLEHNYPNPFNPSTTIRIHIACASEVSVHVYDMAGVMIDRLVDRQRLDAGMYAYSWDAVKSRPLPLASGTYIVRMNATPIEGSARAFTKSMKILLVK